MTRQALSLMDDFFDRMVGRPGFGQFPFLLPPAPLFTSIRTESPFSSLDDGISRGEDGSTVIKMNFAGYDKDEISIDFDEDTLLLEASVSTEEGGQHNRTSYRYRLAKGVKPEDISAEHKNGLLTVTIAPAAEEAEAKGKTKISVT